MKLTIHFWKAQVYLYLLLQLFLHKSIQTIIHFYESHAYVYKGEKEKNVYFVVACNKCNQLNWSDKCQLTFAYSAPKDKCQKWFVSVGILAMQNGMKWKWVSEWMNKWVNEYM